MLDIARATEEQDPLGITYRHADATTEHLADLADSRDLVLSCYAIPYAATRAALTGMFITARTVLREGGRFVAATLNPEYADQSTLPGHYERYNMRLTARRYPPSDGGVVHLTAWFADPTGPAMEVDAYWWSKAAYEEAAETAGFSTITWTHFSVSDLGVQRYGTDLWQNYLNHPHAMVIEVS